MSPCSAVRTCSTSSLLARGPSGTHSIRAAACCSPMISSRCPCSRCRASSVTVTSVSPGRPRGLSRELAVPDTEEVLPSIGSDVRARKELHGRHQECSAKERQQLVAPPHQRAGRGLLPQGAVHLHLGGHAH